MTAPGEIRFEFVTEGEEQFSSVLLDLKTKQVQASSAATDLARELAKLKASGELSAEGVQAVQRQLAAAQLAAQRFGQEATQAARAEQALARESAVATSASRNHARGQAEVVNMISEMSLGLGGLSPQLRELTVAFAGGANNAVQLASSMGPIGIAIGLLGSLIPSLISSLSDTGDAAAETAERVRTAADAINEMADAVQAADRQQTLRSGVGVGSDDAISTEIARLDAARRGFLHDASTAHNVYTGLVAQQNELLRQRGEATRQELAAAHDLGLQASEQARLEREAQDQVNDLAGQISDLQEAMRRSQATGSGGRFGQEVGDDFTDRARALRERLTANDNARRRRGSGRREHERTLEELMGSPGDWQRTADEIYDTATGAIDRIRTEQRRAKDEREHERADELEDIKRKAHEREEIEAQVLDKQKRALREANQAVLDASKSVLEPVIGGLTQALSSVIAGTKSASEAFEGMLSSFLEMIAQQSALKAAFEFAEAIASAAREDWPGFAQHLAGGLAFTAVAVVAGAASVAVAPPAAAPQSPQQQNPDSGKGGGTTILNINGPILSSGSRANLGREIGQLIDEGDRRLGRRAA